MNFEGFTQDIINNGWAVHGVEVYKDGKLTYSFRDTKENTYPIYSCTKSILSIATGIANDQKKIDLNEDLLFYIPQRYKEGLSAQQKKKWENVSLHRLMTMSVPGFPFRPESDNYLDYSLNYPDFRPDDKSFDYSNIPAYLVGVAVTEAVGEDLWEFIGKNILDPLEITDAECSRCSEGYFYGASGMKLSVNDLSRIGLLPSRKI